MARWTEPMSRTGCAPCPTASHRARSPCSPTGTPRALARSSGERLDAYGRRLMLLLAAATGRRNRRAHRRRRRRPIASSSGCAGSLTPWTPRTPSLASRRRSSAPARGPLTGPGLRRRARYGRYGLWQSNAALTNVLAPGQALHERDSDLYRLAPVATIAHFARRHKARLVHSPPSGSKKRGGDAFPVFLRRVSPTEIRLQNAVFVHYFPCVPGHRNRWCGGWCGIRSAVALT